jgi:hypothetical protein
VGISVFAAYDFNTAVQAERLFSARAHAQARMDLAKSCLDRFADFWPLVPPETFSGSIHDSKSRAYARISIDSPMSAITEGLNGGANRI